MKEMEKFVKPDDPVLVRTAEPIDISKISASETQQDIEKMLSVAYGEQVDRMKPLLVGLAAPQIGISKRIILVDIAARGKGEVGDLRVYINPEIIWTSEEKDEWWEGCFSTNGVCGIVSRPTRIKIRAYAREGQPVEEEHEGFPARIIQHEIDHLNGIEFVTHVSDDDNLHWVEKNEFPTYKEAWRNWPNKCSRQKWQQIKGVRK